MPSLRDWGFVPESREAMSIVLSLGRESQVRRAPHAGRVAKRRQEEITAAARPPIDLSTPLVGTFARNTDVAPRLPVGACRVIPRTNVRGYRMPSLRDWVIPWPAFRDWPLPWPSGATGKPLRKSRSDVR